MEILYSLSSYLYHHFHGSTYIRELVQYKFLPQFFWTNNLLHGAWSQMAAISSYTPLAHVVSVPPQLELAV